MSNSNGAETPSADLIAALNAFSQILDAEAVDARAAHLARGLSLSVVVYAEARAAKARCILGSLQAWARIDALADERTAHDLVVDLGDDAAAAVAEAMYDARQLVVDWQDATARRRNARGSR